MVSSGSATPDFLGGGLYQAPDYTINSGAFTNPNFTPGAFQGAQSNYLGATTGPTAVATSGPASTATTNTGIGGELALADKQQQMASGNGPSLADVTAKQQGAANLASAESMLGSARGAGNPAAAQLAAKTAQTTGAQEVAGNAVQGRTAEEMGALTAAGGLYGNVAGQGIQQQQTTNQAGQFNASQANEMAKADAERKLAAYTNNLNTLSAQGLAQQQGAISGQQLGVQQQLGLGQIGEKAYEDAANANAKTFGSIMSGVGGAATMFL